jgi:exoribonuclease R
MTLLKIAVDNRNYGSWTITNANTIEAVSLDINPIQHKLFTNDVFTHNNGKIDIIHSSVRIIDNIPAILVLENNKTYGREILKNNNRGRLYYKCVPDDVRIPTFLVPYEIKQLGFSKVLSNLYVTIRFSEWTDKHPVAVLSQVIGPVDVLDNYYEYLLYCKSLNASIQNFTKNTSKALKDKVSSHEKFVDSIFHKYPQIENRTDKNVWKIFSIDPPKTMDYDDAFSIKNINETQILLSIYISNVSIWLDNLNLWDSFSRRISTIYLPDRKRPMLPSILSDILCSLQKGSSRIALVMDLIIEDGNIVSFKYCNAIIHVSKNYTYEEPDLGNDEDYIKLLELTKKLSRKYKYLANVRNSHELVCYLMVLMNYNTAQELLKYKNGIFRSAIIKKKINIEDKLPDNIPEDVTKFMKIWNSAAGQYIDISKINDDELVSLIKHDLLEMDAYVHITSPIRRLVDLLNIMQLQDNLGIIKLSPSAKEFYTKWISELDYINVTMRAIRRVQADCNMLDLCYNNPEVVEKSYDGYCFDKLDRNDGLYQFIVYLPELRLTSKITVRDNMDNFVKKKYKLVLFSDEERFKRKIRLQLLDEYFAEDLATRSVEDLVTIE